MDDGSTYHWGQWVKDRIRHLGISSRQVAVLVGTTPQNFSRWLASQRMPRLSEDSQRRLALTIRVVPGRLEYVAALYDPGQMADYDSLDMPDALAGNPTALLLLSMRQIIQRYLVKMPQEELTEVLRCVSKIVDARPNQAASMTAPPSPPADVKNAPAPAAVPSPAADPKPAPPGGRKPGRPKG